ncbi:unnamed protein product [Cunninghamella blakesleeana]
MNILEFNNELLTCIAGHLPVEDLQVFSQVCHKFAIIAHSDSVWKEQVYNNFGITYKLPEETWKTMYNKKVEDSHNNKLCPHVGCVGSEELAPYVKRYQQILNWLPKNLNCGTCGSNQAEQGLCLYIWKGNIRLRCRDCAYRFHSAEPNRHGILFRTNVLQMFCFVCNRLLGETRGDPSEAYYVNSLLEQLTRDSDLGQQAMEQKKQCMRERILHREETDRAYILESEPYYLIERVWLCSWFLRLCDGRIGVGPINNRPLATSDKDDTLNPKAKPKGNFSGGFGVCSPKLWHYLVETYGLEGKAYTSDDIKGPEYDELRQAIVDWRLI